MAQTQTNGQVQFLGNDLQMPITGSFQTISGQALLLQDIEQLLLTMPGERCGRPEFGCSLRTRIWENIDDTAQQGCLDIQNAITQYEPRVELQSVNSTIYRNDGLVLFSIQMVVISTNTPLNFVFPFRTSDEIVSAS
jgi:uncharacterized protein